MEARNLVEEGEGSGGISKFPSYWERHDQSSVNEQVIEQVLLKYQSIEADQQLSYF